MTSLSFTVILPTLNAEGPLLECALRSIAEQDYPADLVEVIVPDGGSVDGTRALAASMGARVIENPRKLAEWGVKEGVLASSTDLVVMFAADNELVGRNWFARVARQYDLDPLLSAVYGRLASGPDDSSLNKYVALIQSEPLTWFLNRNLEKYLAGHTANEDGFVHFDVDRRRPLVWGANGFVIRREHVLPIWQRKGYVGDVDAFYASVLNGNTRVAYLPTPYCYHHQVATLGDYRRKWLRNSRSHIVAQADERDMSWALGAGFRTRAALWVLYAVVPVFSTADALRRAWRDRDPHWLYHPLVTLLQFATYVQGFASSPRGRRVVAEALRRRK